MAKIDLSNIDFSRVKKEHLVLICTALIAGVILFSYKNIFNPLLGKIKTVSTQIEQRKNDIQRAKIAPQDLSEHEQEIEELRTQIDYFQKRLEGKVNMPQILKELNQLAEQLKIKFISVNPLEGKDTPLPGEEESLFQLPIKIKLRSGYHQLGIFINQIENLSSFMKVTGFKLSADSRDIWVHQAELTITTYRLVGEK